MGGRSSGPQPLINLFDITIAKTSDVSITIYDETGRIINCIYSQTTLAGSHTIPLNFPKNIKSGTYFYTMEVKQNNATVYSATKRMLIIQ